MLRRHSTFSRLFWFQVKEFQRFPLLREEIIKVVSQLLKERLPVANAMVHTVAVVIVCVGGVYILTYVRTYVHMEVYIRTYVCICGCQVVWCGVARASGVQCWLCRLRI